MESGEEVGKAKMVHRKDKIWVHSQGWQSSQGVELEWKDRQLQALCYRVEDETEIVVIMDRNESKNFLSLSPEWLLEILYREYF